MNESSSFYYWWSGTVSLACFYNYFMIVIMIFEDVYRHFYFKWICANVITDFIFLTDILVQGRKGSLVSRFFSLHNLKSSFIGDKKRWKYLINMNEGNI